MCCFYKKGMEKQYAGHENLEAPEYKSQILYFIEMAGLLKGHVASLP